MIHVVTRRVRSECKANQGFLRREFSSFAKPMNQTDLGFDTDFDPVEVFRRVVEQIRYVALFRL